jgi:hypothetical protein
MSLKNKKNDQSNTFNNNGMPVILTSRQNLNWYLPIL